MDYFYTLLIGILGGFVGVLVGSGGLITIPFLIFLGLPPQVAIATNRMGSAGLAIGATASFWKSNKIRWDYVIRFIPLSIIGAFIGAQLLLDIPENIVNYLIAGIILVILPLVLFNKQLGLVRTKTSAKKQLLGYIAYIGYAIFSGFFGAGGGTLVLFITLFFFGFEFLEVHASMKFPWMFSIAISLIIFSLNGLVWVQYGIPLLAGTLIGSYVGGKLALRKGNQWLKIVFVVAVSISALRLLFL